MKKLLSFLFLFSMLNFGYSQDGVIGVYYTENRRCKVEVFEDNGKYYGKIVWGRRQRNDYNNPDPALKSRSLLNVIIMKDFEYNGKDLWENGTIYDPENGKTYSCMMWVGENGDLIVRGYVGFSFFGRTVIFTKY